MGRHRKPWHTTHCGVQTQGMISRYRLTHEQSEAHPSAPILSLPSGVPATSRRV